MKKLSTLLIILLFSLLTNAQEEYKSLWQQVEKLETDNLPKSALVIVENIHTKATKENNSEQIIKSLFYQSKFALLLEEDAQLKVITAFKQQISKSTFPTKNILQNILANLYWQYFTQNKYVFYNRTKTENKSSENDFRTWDLQTLFHEIHTNFSNSLQQTELLKKESILLYKEIVFLAKETKKHKPSLYDFLANNALEFYTSTETSITKPTYKFVINNPDFLSDYTTFSQLQITSKDSLSLEYNALKIYQNLIQFHRKENNLVALASTDIERLHFIKNNATFNTKDTLFFTCLENSFNNLDTQEASGLYAFEMAKIYKERQNNKKALSICNVIIAAFPKSLGAINCNLLKKQIQEKTVSITAEKYVPKYKNSRLLIRYKNLNSLFFTSYKITPEQLKTYYKTYNFTEKKQVLNSLEKTESWQVTLRNEEDYLEHTTEVVVPKFKNGFYVIIASESPNIKEEEIYGTAIIQATNLALIENNFDEKYNYQVVDRNTGKPIANAQLHFKNTNKKNRLNQKIITNKNGFASITRDNIFYNDIEITVKTSNEVATFGKFYLYNYYNNNNIENTNKTILKAFVFTDRSIYRPGQTVYFKTIVLKKQGEKSEVFTNEFVSVSLLDVNGQDVKKLNLKLNEFGSIAGEFVLPNTGLTGEFTIEVEESLEEDSKQYYSFDYDNSVTISVEEYKKPKFETDFKPITESYKLKDSITVNGFAKAFSGANITDAKVVYRVHRKVQYPNWWYWYKPHTNYESQEIAHGEITTDASGNFSIRFLAQPDETVSKDGLPIFNFEVTADVTDINGETHSATTTVNVGHHALLATIAMSEKIDKNQPKAIVTIDTKNLNNQFIAATGSITIYKLQAPKNPIRKRPWQNPDYQDISEDEFRRLFPNEAYTKEETEDAFWQKGNMVFSSEFNTQISKEIVITDIKNWVSGKYIVVLKSKDTFGQLVKDERKFSLFSTIEKQVPDNSLFVIQTNKASYASGDMLELQIGSASKDMHVVLQIEKNNTIVDTQLIALKNNIKTIKIPIQKKDIGGFAIKYHFVNYNYFQSGSLLISVPEVIKNIEIETNVFRDKLQPGQKQTWSFSIKNDETNQISAEILASMYDASLDQFKPHVWQFNPIQPKNIYYSYKASTAYNSFGNTNFSIQNKQRNYTGFVSISNNQYNWFGLSFQSNRNMYLRGKVARLEMVADEVAETSMLNEDLKNSNSLDEIVVTGYKAKEEENTKEKLSLKGIKTRKNFQETAFFFPQLKTDTNGKVSFSFTMPDALTRWKLQLLAHNKTLQSATKTLQTITQKELMVVPNLPRFLRQGDTITFSTKITNLTNNSLSGVAQLMLFDAVSGKEINSELRNVATNRNFKVNSDGNTNVSWQLVIPETVQAVQYKIIAKAGNFTDGEQNVLPVVTNRMLVTETLPMWLGSNQTKSFILEKLKNNSSPTLKNHQLTLEITSNPAWYAIKALPYLMEYPYECAEQTFAKYYANTLASFVVNSNPRIQEVFKAWQTSDALLSNLEKNQELKSLILQETPWLRDAQSETEQKKRIALLFDITKMSEEQKKTLNKLEDMQMPSGGFPWFKGGRHENTFITQHIATGFGHLQKLGVTNFSPSAKQMLEKSIAFLDEKITNQYNAVLQNASKLKQKAKTTKEGEKAYHTFLEKNNLNYFTIQYLYMRSFYSSISIGDKAKIAVDYYRNQSAKYWNDYNLYAKGQIAVTLYRNDEKIVAKKILNSIQENAIVSKELGMYWKENTAGYFYYQAPVETQALLIEVFSEIENNKKTIDNLKIWLLKNKQTNQWKTTKATTESVYALLLNGNDWLSVTETVQVKIGDKNIQPTQIKEAKVEAGTGYFKTSWQANEITPEMAEVTLTKTGNGIAWGGLYWQYFEDLDKISSAESPLKLTKKLFLKINSDTGKELQLVQKNTPLKVGDLITIRIELKSDRDMEFIHMKDMRAAGLEPIHILSGYKWQDNLGYYQSTKDVATNFFFDRLPKGIYVFEYDLRVTNAGNFSNGITTIQSMYAPEFSSHSKGERMQILEK